MNVCIVFSDGLQELKNLPACLANTKSLMVSKPGTLKNIVVEFSHTARGVIFFKEQANEKAGRAQGITRIDRLRPKE